MGDSGILKDSFKQSLDIGPQLCQAQGHAPSNLGSTITRVHYRACSRYILLVKNVSDLIFDICRKIFGVKKKASSYVSGILLGYLLTLMTSVYGRNSRAQ